MRARSYFWGSFLAATGIQIVIVCGTIAANVAGKLHWFQRFTDAMYSPVTWLTEHFASGSAEADVGLGLVFLPPVVLSYSLAFAAFVFFLRKAYDANPTASPNGGPPERFCNSGVGGGPP